MMLRFPAEACLEGKRSQWNAYIVVLLARNNLTGKGVLLTLFIAHSGCAIKCEKHIENRHKELFL